MGTYEVEIRLQRNMSLVKRRSITVEVVEKEFSTYCTQCRSEADPVVNWDAELDRKYLTPILNLRP